MRTCCCSLAGTKYCETCINGSTGKRLDDYIDYNHYRSNGPRVIKSISLTELMEKDEDMDDESKKTNSVEEQIKDVEELIREIKRLQNKYPKHKKELRLGLMGLEELRKEMLESLR